MYDKEVKKFLCYTFCPLGCVCVRVCVRARFVECIISETKKMIKQSGIFFFFLSGENVCSLWLLQFDNERKTKSL